MTDGFHFKPRADVPDTPADALNLRLHNAIADAISREYHFAVAGKEIGPAQIAHTIAAALIGVLTNHLAQSLKPEFLEARISEVTDAVANGTRLISQYVAAQEAPDKRKVH